MTTLLSRFLDQRPLTSARVRSAYAVAVATDLVQMALGPFGWAFADEILDAFAMIAISRIIGFHALLLPTFIVEFLPIADMLPTWTGSVALVLTLRRRKQTVTAPPSSAPVIDI